MSEGGGWAAPPSTTGAGAEGPPQQEQQQVEIDKLTEEDIDSVCLFVFKFDELHEKLMMRDAILQLELDGLYETKELYDSRTTNLKKTTKSPDSNKLKQLKFATRKSLELEELINDRKMELHEVHLLKIKSEAAMRSNVSLLSQYAAHEEEGSMIGYLARIMRMD